MVKYVKQSHEIITPFDGVVILKGIESIGRVCYKSEDKITDDSYLAFAKMLVGRGHFSVIEHVNVTVKFITNRGVTHELVRHRLAAYSQESTRYCNYAGNKFGNEITVIDREGLPNIDYKLWAYSMREIEGMYMNLVGVLKWPPQIARGVLPNDLKTEIVMTANLREWGHVFKLRTADGAHPDIKALMEPLLAEFRAKIPVLFDDLSKY